LCYPSKLRNILMPKLESTKETLALAKALQVRGVEIKLEHWDGHKHVDIFIPRARIYLEIDGVPHYTEPDRLVADFNRDFYSFKEGYFTKHITNEAINSHLDKIADAITAVTDSMLR